MLGEFLAAAGAWGTQVTGEIGNYELLWGVCELARGWRYFICAAVLNSLWRQGIRLVNVSWKGEQRLQR